MIFEMMADSPLNSSRKNHSRLHGNDISLAGDYCFMAKIGNFIFIIPVDRGPSQ